MDTDEEENDLPEQQQPGPSGRRRQRDSPPEDELSIDEINRQIALDTLRHQREMHELERRRAQIDTQPAGGTGTSQDVLEEDEFGESSLTPAERQHLTLFPRVDKKHIISIVKHKFHANNLVYLDRQAAAEAEPEMSITLSNGAWKQKKVVGKLSDFGPTSEIWSRNFLVFVQILQAFFGTTHPTLSIELLNFHGRIVKLAKIHKWQGCILNMAVEFMERRRSESLTDATAWRLDYTTINEWTLDTQLLANPQSVGTSSAPSAGRRPRIPNTNGQAFHADAPSNNPSVTCRMYNTPRGCSESLCRRKHNCSHCGGAHSGSICESKQKS
jgi:hypothetical protein